MDKLPEQKIYEFGEFRFDAGHLMLYRGIQEVSLAPKAAETLLALIERRGQIVSKDELMKTIWADAIVEESNLFLYLSVLRKLLGKRPDGREYVETLRRRGYRFSGEVRVVPIDGQSVSNNGAFNTQLPETIPEQTRTGRSASYFRLSLILVFLMAIAGIGFGLYSYANSKRSMFAFDRAKAHRMTSSGRVKNAAISPDGKFLVYVKDENHGKRSLWIRQIENQSDDVQIASPAEIVYNGLTFSKDSNSLYFNGSDGSLFRMPSFGGVYKKIADGKALSVSSPVELSPDETSITFLRQLDSGETAIFVSRLDGTSERQIAVFEASTQLGGLIEWSPDGKAIACWSITDGRQNLTVVVVADGIFKHLLGDGWPTVGTFSWMPDSKSIFVSGEKSESAQLSNYQIWQVLYPTGDAHQVTNDTTNYDKICITTDGKNLAAVRSERVAHVWASNDYAVNAMKQQTAGFEKVDGIWNLGWVRDGRVVYDSTQGGKTSVWIADAAGEGSRILQSNAYFPLSVSPDGRYLVHQKAERANIGLWVTDILEGVERQLTKSADVWPSFSADGKWIVYTSYREKIGVYKVPVEGGEPVLIVEVHGLSPTVSPDGSKIAFFLPILGENGKIAVANFDSGKIIRTFAVRLDFAPLSSKVTLQWAADGSAVNYLALNDGVSNLWRWNIDGDTAEQLTNFETGRIFNFAYSKNGDWLALSRGSFDSDTFVFSNVE